MKKVAISVGDLNGIGIELILRNHYEISKSILPIYCIDKEMLLQASDKLQLKVPSNFQTIDNIAPYFQIKAGEIDKQSGAYSYASFYAAVQLAKEKKVDGICTLPIHKKAWELAGINYKGHTDALRDFFKTDAIMMLGCQKLFVALFTEHIPLKDVAASLSVEKLTNFLMNFAKSAKPANTVGVLGLNPHAGDGGVLGDEEEMITHAIIQANSTIGKELFTGPLVPDVAFTPHMRSLYTHMAAMYHDQGLAPLKALYFDESINVSLCLPILRTSVDHGTAFDIAYKGMTLNSLSYLNAIRYIVDHISI